MPKLSVSGSASKEIDLDIGDDVVLVVRGKVKRKGEQSTESSGVQEFVTIRADRIEAVSGEEANQWMERFKRIDDEEKGVEPIPFDKNISEIGEDDDEEEDTEDLEAFK